MATTYQDTVGNGSNKVFNFGFTRLKDSDVKVQIDQIKIASTEYAVSDNPTKITFNNNSINSAVQETDGAPKDTLLVRVYRDTEVDTAKVVFAAGSSIRAADLNNNQEQALYSSQEQQNLPISKWQIQADAIDGTKIADASINSEHIVNGSVDRAHLEADIIDGTKIADNAVDTEHIANEAITSAKIENATIQAADIANDAISATQIGSNAITTAKILNDAVNGDKIADNSIDSDHYVDGSIDAVHIAANTITASQIATGALDGRYYTETELTNGALDGRYFTETEADARYFNVSTGDTIKDGDTFPDNDTTIATTAAINDRIIDLVDDVGGFVPIANETSFPTANPDVNNGAGTLVSIKALANNLVSNGSGVATISNGAGTGNTVTINGLANSTTYAATFGMIVETTSTLHTYAFHRLVPKATEVTTVSGSIANVNTVAAAIGNVNSVSTNATNVNTVAGSIANVNTVGGAIANVNTVATNINGVHHYADVYQVGTSAPSARTDSSSLQAGDMWFDSSSNKELRVHNGTAYQLVTPSQSVLDDIAIVSGNITFAEDLGLITASLTTGTGNSIETCADSISNIQTCHTNIANINTTAGAIANVNTVGGAIANVNTVGGSIADVNRYANEYKIASSNPGSPSAGDLWYNSTGNTLNYYNGSSWIGISPGINAVISDTTPELGGHLDCNDKNLTEVATISGTNLQIDFGTI